MTIEYHLGWPVITNEVNIAKMKVNRKRAIYTGVPSENHRECVTVTLLMDSGKVTDSYILPLYTELVNHSPDGFNWGYGGSGPHQLGFAILMDLTKDLRLTQRKYHQFVRDVISILDIDKPFRLTSESIWDWLDKAEAAK